MKNWLFSLLLAFCLLYSGKLVALPNGNPSFPMMPEQGLFFKKDAWLTLKAGYEWEDLFNRKLTVREHRDHLKRRVGLYEAMGNFGVVTLGCNDRVEVYGVLGEEKATIHYHPYSDVRLHFTTQHEFAWTVGGRAILAYWGDIQLGVDAKYFQFNPSIHTLKVNGASINPDGAYYRYGEWQIGLGASYRIQLFTPYIGLKYSDASAKMRHLNAIDALSPQKHLTMENAHPLGLFLGCGFALDRALNINFEARFFDETAITASTDLRF